jgi:hypothetical protein
MFEDLAQSLDTAYRTARDRYAAAELLLQAAVVDEGDCDHQEALNTICRVNDAVGHVMLGVVPFDQATAHLQAVTPFHLAEVLRAMRRQLSRAALAVQEQSNRHIYAFDRGHGVDSAEGGARLPLPNDSSRDASTRDEREDETRQYITLDQAAALINRKKKTLERYLNDPSYKKFQMPQPEVEGGGGKPHEWLWSTLRPWLESTFARKLPERFPRR